MAIVKWNRFGMPRFLEEDMWPTLSNWEEILQTPNGIDIYETDDNVVVEAQIPGIEEENVDITVEGNVLNISAKQEESEEQKNKKKTIYKSTKQTCFNYSTNLPRMVDVTKAEAEINNGLIKIVIPKVEEEKPKKIDIKKKIK